MTLTYEELLVVIAASWCFGFAVATIIFYISMKMNFPGYKDKK